MQLLLVLLWLVWQLLLIWLGLARLAWQLVMLKPMSQSRLLKVVVFGYAVLLLVRNAVQHGDPL